MPRNKKEKDPKDMTTDELAQYVFPPKVLAKLKEIAQEGEGKPDTKESSHEE